MTDYGDLSYLLKANYEEAMRALLGRAKTLGVHEIRKYDSIFANSASSKGQVYLVPYLDEDYTSLARVLRIWPFPRGHFRHVALLRYRYFAT
jgi:hypothetical protein